VASGKKIDGRAVDHFGDDGHVARLAQPAPLTFLAAGMMLVCGVDSLKDSREGKERQ